MANTHSPASTDLNFLAILLLIAYLLTSAPAYMKYLKENKDDLKIEKVSPLRQVWKAGKAYTIDPYANAFRKIGPGVKEWASKVSLTPVSTSTIISIYKSII